jgi:hypothetical protein
MHRLPRTMPARPHLAKHALWLLPLFLAPAAWWWPLLTGKLPDFMDTVTYLFPMRVAVAQQLHSATLPLWLPSLFCGAPLAANPQVAAWYPPQLLFYFVPGAFTYGLLCIFHYWLAGVGAYALTYWHTRSRYAGLLAGLTFQFGAMMIGRIALLPHVYSSAWVPWIFLAAEASLASLTSRVRRADLALALLLAIQLLSGAPQISYYTGIALLLLWLIRWLQSPHRFSSLTPLAIRGLVIVALTSTIAAIQILPTAEFMSLVRRHPIAVQDLITQSLGRGYLFTSLFGFTFPQGEDTDSINAVGIVPYLLAIIAVLRTRTRSRTLPYVIISFVGWILASGYVVPLLVAVLPGFDRFHAPRRALMLWSILMPIAAGIGAGHVAELFRGRRSSGLVLASLALLSIASTIWILPRIERVFCRPEHLYPNAAYVDKIGSARFITVDPTLNYSYDSRRPDYGQSIIPNGAILGGVNDAQGYDPIMLERYASFRDVLCATSGILYPGHAVYFSDPAAPALRILNVQYLVGRHDIYDPGHVVPGASFDRQKLNAMLEPVIADERWPLFRYREQRPFAWSVQQLEPVSTMQQAMLLAKSANVEKTAFVEQPFTIAADRTGTTSVTAEWTSSRSLQLHLSAGEKRPAFICVAISYVPGWRAFAATGEELTTVPADGVILGVQVPAGVSDVRLIYSPRSFYQGLAISIAAMVLSFGLWFRCRPVTCLPAPHQQ